MEVPKRTASRHWQLSQYDPTQRLIAELRTRAGFSRSLALPWRISDCSRPSLGVVFDIAPRRPASRHLVHRILADGASPTRQICRLDWRVGNNSARFTPWLGYPQRLRIKNEDPATTSPVGTASRSAHLRCLRYPDPKASRRVLRGKDTPKRADLGYRENRLRKDPPPDVDSGRLLHHVWRSKCPPAANGSGPTR
jgi:hypothetical protein